MSFKLVQNVCVFFICFRFFLLTRHRQALLKHRRKSALTDNLSTHKTRKRLLFFIAERLRLINNHVTVTSKWLDSFNQNQIFFFFFAQWSEKQNNNNTKREALIEAIISKAIGESFFLLFPFVRNFLRDFSYRFKSRQVASGRFVPLKTLRYTFAATAH